MGLAEEVRASPGGLVSPWSCASAHTVRETDPPHMTYCSNTLADFLFLLCIDK